uniref:non-specific serine/threonine protein kinase n=1 Tax=Chenopodium quinoa TaxID=63459 RepID=A0A803KZD9_CHEQI
MINAAPEIQIDIGKPEHRVVFSDKAPSKVSHLGWGRWYTLRELELATNGLADENVIGEGGYGIVYHGILQDNTQVAVKNLLNNRGQAEKEFKVEVEAIGRVRHKNLVRLLGYCVEGAYRMLVYEYVDNGNLDQWLHGDVGDVSPLTWDIRMNVILGTAKGLAYLHEGLEPKVVHRDIKSSNILIDRQWNSKVSDFGLAKLLGSEMSYVTTRVMGTFGYVAPEYACTGMLTEKSDVYSFGILIMEIISGRTPVDYSRPPGEVNLVDWLKTMVGNRRSEEVVDPKLPEMPTSKALKRILLVALKCVDPDSHKRPKMGHVIHMLEADDLLFRDDRRAGRESATSVHDHPQAKPVVAVKADAKHLRESTTDNSESETSRDHHHEPNRRR